MRVFLVGVALTLMAQAAFPAIEYEFVQTSRMPNAPSSDFAARAIIDGQRSRVDFRSGNAFPPGTYVLSNDGARKLQFVDPTQKAYTEVNAVNIASAIGSSNILIGNLRQDVIRLPETQMIAGIPADHYRQTISYDITVRFGTMPMTQSVRTEIDKWTTTRFGDVSDIAFGNNRIQTGNPNIDEVISAETTKIKGFPLKQTIRITTVDANANKRTGSELKLPASRTRTREMTVTAIKETNPEESLFNVPAAYKKNDFAERAHKSQMQVLSMEPASE